MKRDINAIVEQNIHLVHSVARSRFALRLPDDDLIQCGMIGLWEAAQKWGGVSNFSPFARTCIYHNMLDYIRGMSAIKRLPCDELEETSAIAEDQYLDIETEDLLQEFREVLGEQSQEYIILSQIVLNGEIRPAERFLSLDVSEVRKVARKAYKAVKKARERE